MQTCSSVCVLGSLEEAAALPLKMSQALYFFKSPPYVINMQV